MSTRCFATLLVYTRELLYILHRTGPAARVYQINGTAPIEVSSGNRKVFRLSRRGNRDLNQAIHMAAITQIRYRHNDGRVYYEKKMAEGKSHKEALQALKRRISDALYARMVADSRRLRDAGPGGHSGNVSVASAAGSHPDAPALKPIPNPSPPYDARSHHTQVPIGDHSEEGTRSASNRQKDLLTNKEDSFRTRPTVVRSFTCRPR